MLAMKLNLTKKNPGLRQKLYCGSPGKIIDYSLGSTVRVTETD